MGILLGVTRFPRLLGVFILLVGFLAFAATPVAAATPKRIWQATIGSSRVLGTASLALYPSYVGSVRISIRGLTPRTTWQAMIYKGTCAHPTALVKLPGIRTDGSGNGLRVTALTVANGITVWSTAANGSVAVRIASGTTAYCERLTYPVATRVEIPRYGIDLPIVHQPAGLYPYCNVALYASALSQPGEAGPTFIYAHARTGMFLPLLTASQTNAAGMVGMTVRVWTSDSRLYAYRITRVLRHQYSTPAYDQRVETLWLQTSEGPRGTRNKLFLVGTRVSVAESTYAAAHPTPRLVVCG